jgi:regulator of sigma E protease
MLEAENGWKLILWFAVVLNVNLAVLNILPLPIVDGGHVVLGTLEIIFRRPVGGKILEWIQTGFIFLLVTFFIFITFKILRHTCQTTPQSAFYIIIKNLLI